MEDGEMKERWKWRRRMSRIRTIVWMMKMTFHELKWKEVGIECCNIFFLMVFGKN